MASEDREKRIGFLYRSVGENIHPHYMEFWIKNREFQEEVCNLLDSKQPVDKQAVLSIMTRIQSKYRQAKANGEVFDFNFNWARRAINKLSKELGVYEGPNRKGFPSGSNSEGS